MSDEKLSTLLEEYASVALYIDGKEAEIAGIKKIAANIKAAIQAKMSAEEITSAKTKDGHSMVMATTTSCKVEDADAFFQFVFDKGDESFIQRRANNDAVVAYLKETNELPPGIKMDSVTTLRFTKAKVRA